MEQALISTEKKNPPLLLGAYTVVFSILHLSANFFGWYETYAWLDIPVHILGAVFVAWVAYAYRDRITGYTNLPIWVQALGLVTFVALVGVLWELWEGLLSAYHLYTSGLSLGTIPEAFNQLPQLNNRWDTLFDLFDDLVGGTLVGLYVIIWHHE